MENHDVRSKIDGQKIGEIHFKTTEELDNFLSSVIISHPTYLIYAIKSIIEDNRNQLITLLISEIGKPYSESAYEVEQCLDILETFLEPTIIENKQDSLLIIGSIANPLYELVSIICENVYKYEKFIYKPSSKSSFTLDFLYQKMVEDIEICSKLFVMPMTKDNFDTILKSNKYSFNTIINFSRAKISQHTNLITASQKDQIVLIDSNTDLEIAVAYITENLFNFSKFNMSRVQHIFVQKDVKNEFLEKIISKINLLLKPGRVDKPDINFSDILRFYKRTNFREDLLEMISQGVDIVYGSVEEILKSPIILSLNEKYEEYYKKSFWYPILFIIEYDTYRLPELLKPFKNFKVKSFLNDNNSF